MHKRVAFPPSSFLLLHALLTAVCSLSDSHMCKRHYPLSVSCLTFLPEVRISSLRYVHSNVSKVPAVQSGVHSPHWFSSNLQMWEGFLHGFLPSTHTFEWCLPFIKSSNTWAAQCIRPSVLFILSNLQGMFKCCFLRSSLLLFSCPNPDYLKQAQLLTCIKGFCLPILFFLLTYFWLWFALDQVFKPHNPSKRVLHPFQSRGLQGTFIASCGTEQRPLTAWINLVPRFSLFLTFFTHFWLIVSHTIIPRLDRSKVPVCPNYICSGADRWPHSSSSVGTWT